MEFWWCCRRDPQMCTKRVPSGCRVKPRRPPNTTKIPREDPQREKKKTREDPQREKKRHGKTPREKKKTGEDPQRKKKTREDLQREKKTKMVAGEEKKARNFGPPRAPTIRAPSLRGFHQSGPLLFWVPNAGTLECTLHIFFCLFLWFFSESLHQLIVNQQANEVSDALMTLSTPRYMRRRGSFKTSIGTSAVRHQQQQWNNGVCYKVGGRSAQVNPGREQRDRGKQSETKIETDIERTYSNTDTSHTHIHMQIHTHLPDTHPPTHRHQIPTQQHTCQDNPALNHMCLRFAASDQFKHYRKRSKCTSHRSSVTCISFNRGFQFALCSEYWRQQFACAFGEADTARQFLKTSGAARVPNHVE